MSYPRDLDEIPSSELVKELLRRHNRLVQGLCPYCKRRLRMIEYLQTTQVDINPMSASVSRECNCRFGVVIDDYHNPTSLNPIRV